MSIAGLVLLLVFVAGAILFVAWPFISGESAVKERVSASATRLQQLRDEREAVLIAIRDLDFDYHTGKLTEQDYAAQRELLVQRGVAILKQIDLEQGQRPQTAE